MPARKIMIIRHAEKPTITPAGPLSGVTFTGEQASDSLIVQGWQRAGGLINLFAPARGPLQSPELATPQFLFATSTSADGGNRPEETITPLGAQINVDPVLFADSESDQVATAAMNCNGVALICWPHGKIPKVTATIALHMNPNPFAPNWSWPSTRFDIVFVFDLDASTGNYTFNQVPQLLLWQDSPNPIPITS